MHQHTINASLQLLPVDRSKHAYTWVDDIIAIIKGSGLLYEVGPFNTSVEGKYGQVQQLVYDINDWLVNNDCEEWILQVQYQLRAQGPIHAIEKTEKHR